MNIKRIAIVGCAVALIGAMSATAFAGTVTGSGMFANRAQKTAPTATQVAENQANREARQADMAANKETRQADMAAVTEKWDGLTDTEKESAYTLIEARINAEIAVIENNVDLGLMDADKADEQIANLTDKIANLRTDGKIPMMGGFSKGGVEGRNQDRNHDRNPSATQDTTVTE